MVFLIRFLTLILITYLACKVYEKRKKNAWLIISIYFVITAVIFLL